MNSIQKTNDNAESEKSSDVYAGEIEKSSLQKLMVDSESGHAHAGSSPSSAGKVTTVVIDDDDDDDDNNSNNNKNNDKVDEHEQADRVTDNNEDSSSPSSPVMPHSKTLNEEQDSEQDSQQPKDATNTTTIQDEDDNDGNEEMEDAEPLNDSAIKLTRFRRGPARRGLNQTTPNTNNKGTTGSSNASRKSAPGETTLRRLMREARYEIDHDSYRGVARYTHASKLDAAGDDRDNKEQQSATIEVQDQNKVVDKVNEKMRDGTKFFGERLVVKRSPWDRSCSPFSSDSGDTVGNSDDASTGSSTTQPTTELSVAEEMVKWACHNKCPTMIQWTDRAIDQSKRKSSGRKRKGLHSNHNMRFSSQQPTLGKRPEGRDIRCKCDANPFCLATLGGAMNDVIMRDLKAQLSINGEEHYFAASEEEKESGRNGSINNSSTEDDDADTVELIEPNKYNRPKTTEQLKKIRRSTWVDEIRVRQYLKRTLQDLSSGPNLDHFMEIIRKFHEKLIFHNPVDEEENQQAKPENQMELSIPPGIQNLGATCYLNTQLQCLAQNTVFLEGILSWEPPRVEENRDRMTSVLQLFQSLLVSMHAGPKATIETLKFSDALGLDHFEQQDPNEFSRLFFDKIHESFLQQGNAMSETQETSDSYSQYDLAQLLPTLFQGVIRYETTCLQCKTVSTRKEEFMDLNLNIAKPEEKKQKGQQSLADAFFGTADVDVQFCLDRYCNDETLSGDNQYLCNSCDEKRDATRRLCFQKLPPVLNVQLSRYIFDVDSLSKKKVMHKVLLPRTLNVPQREEHNASTENKRYVLCAVMKHQGKSAYSGHYIAEAMDWITGEWFEFNDEKVSLLKTGPSNSFDPVQEKKSDDECAAKAKKPPPGSQDAYNLYYVEEEFLAQSVHEFLMKRRKKNSAELPSILNSVAIERSEAFADLTQLCLDDRLVHNQLQNRRESILEYVFPPNYTRITLTPSFVWIDSDFLRRIMSCEKTLEDEMSDEDVRRFIDENLYRCHHVPCGVEPRLARKGKLLPKPMFESLLKILKAEGGELLPCMISSSNIVCAKCDDSFKRQLDSKHQRLKKISFLYEKLDPKEDDESSALKEGAEHFDREDETSDVFLVSRKFISAFRGEVAKTMKKSVAAYTTGPIETELLSINGEFAGEGLDALNLEMFADEKDCADVDVLVNSKITCDHGNCLNTVSKRSVRYVSSFLWTRLNMFFPNAIEHRVPKRLIQSKDEPRVHFGCSQCESNDLVADAMSATLSSLAKLFLNQPGIGAISGKDILTRDVQPFRLVRTDNLAALQKFCFMFKRFHTKTSTESIKSSLEEIFRLDNTCDFGLSPELPTEADQTFVHYMGKFIQPLVCRAHAKAIRTAVIAESDAKRSIHTLNNSVTVLDENGYQEFITQLAAPAILLVKASRENFQLNDLDLDIDEVMKDASDLCTRSNVSRCHPTIRSAVVALSDQFVVCMESANVSVILHLDDGVCDDPLCNSRFTDFLKLQAGKTDSKPDPPEKKNQAATETISIDSDDDDKNNKKTPTAKQDMFLSLPVVEVESGAEDQRIIESLAQVSGMPSTEVCENPTVRRSGRRKKMRFPVGIVQSEECLRFNLHENLASLRMLLLERCQQGAPFALANLIRLLVWSKPKADIESPLVFDVDVDASTSQEMLHPSIIDLPFSLNEKSLLDICEEKLSAKLKIADLENYVYLVRCASLDPSAKEILEENLMDHLLSLASVGDTNSKTGKRKKPAPEKGFKGTFLTSTNNRPQSPLSAKTSVLSTPKKSAIREDNATNSCGAGAQKRARFADGLEIIDNLVTSTNGGYSTYDDPVELLEDGDGVSTNANMPRSSTLTNKNGNDDHRLVGLATAAALSSSTSTSYQGTSSSDLVAGENMELALKVAGLLMRNPSVESEPLSLDAASWAVAMYPGKTDPNLLVDDAYAKYCDLAE
ncbi:hypothetical protein ACA910_007817 [Epithemia clementina (nom. ined.)]